MITYYNNTLNTLSVEAYKTCNAKVLLLKSISDNLDRVSATIISLVDYIRDVKVCTPLYGGYKFNEQEVRGFNSTQLIPDFRGTDVDKLIQQLRNESVIIVPPTKWDMPSQPILKKMFLEKLNTHEEMRDKNIFILLEGKEWSML